MEKDRQDLIGLITENVFKILPPFIVGAMAKIANDVRDGRKLSIFGWTAIVAMSLSGTFLANWTCEYYEMSKNQTVIINAFATLFSEQLFKMLFGNALIIIQAWIKQNLKFTLNSMDNNSSGNNNTNNSNNNSSGDSGSNNTSQP